jgi:hypothetical protein
LTLNAEKKNNVKLGKKKNGKFYFPASMDDSVITFQQAKTSEEKNEIYIKDIKPTFDLLILNIVNTFKFYKLDGNITSLIQRAETHIYQKLEKYSPERWSAFSFFSISCKHFFLGEANSQKKISERNVPVYKENIHEDYPSLMIDSISEKIEKEEFIKFIIDELTKFVDRSLTRKNDKIIGEAIVNIIRDSERMEIYNKKALYVMLRNITGLSTKSITRIVSILKDEYYKIVRRFNEV